MWCEDLGIDNWYDKYEYNNEVMEYLHGKCHQWVINNYQDGDKCVAIMEERDYVDHLCLMHCCLLRDGQYFDVRGNTYYFENVIDGFDYGDYEVFEFDTLDNFKEMLQDIDIPYEDILENLASDAMENEECR